MTPYGEPVATSGTSPSASRTRSSRARPYGAWSLLTCTPVAPDLPRDARHDVLGAAGQHPQPAVGALLELAQAAVEEGQARRPGRAAQDVVEHEQRQDLVGLVAGGEQGGVVGQAEVTAEPQDSGRHGAGR